MDLRIFELQNYWLPLIWIFGAGLILGKIPKKTELLNGKYVERWYWFTAFVLVLPLILWAGARNRFGDTSAYRRKFVTAPTFFEDLPNYMTKHTEDPGFYLFTAICRCLGLDDVKYFTIIAAVQLLCIVTTFRRYSDNFWICMFLFIGSTDYFAWMYNGMRQFIAATMIFAAFRLLVEKRYVLYIAVIVLAAQFHASAYIMLPLSFLMQGKALNAKTLLLIVGTAVLLPVIDRFIPFLDTLLQDTQYGDVAGDEIWVVDDGTNLFRVLVYSVPALIALFGWRYIRNCEDPVINLCINSALLTMAVYLVSSVTSGIYIGRLPIYTTFQGYIALPWMIDRIFEKRTAGVIRVIMVGCYCAFYYFQMGVQWGKL